MTKPIRVQIIDVGAAAINETPIYKNLFDLDLAYLSLFDGDERQLSKIRDTYGHKNVALFNNFLFDGITPKTPIEPVIVE